MSHRPADKFRRPGMVYALRRIAVAALLIPFLLLSMFSNGTMLTRTAEDRITVVLCIGAEQVDMVWGPDGSLTPVGDEPTLPHTYETTCDWQLTAQKALDVQPAEVQFADISPVPHHLSIDVPLHLRRIDVLASSARGPPRLI